MAHNTTVFRQLLDLLPRHEFDAEARQHQEGQRLRVMSRWAQFVALGLGQLGGLQSLRDIVGNLRAQPHKLYHLGVRAFVSRSSLARVNAQQPYTLYEALFGRLLARCQQRAPRHGFRFKNKLYAVDASTIDLCLAAFPWASFRRTKGAIKLHVGVDLAGHLPTFISVTDGKTGDVTVARTWTFPAGSVVVADRAYLDFGWLHQLQQRGVTFVTRLKRNVRYQVVREHDVDIRTGVLSDQTIELTSARSRKAYPGTLRRVGYWDEDNAAELRVRDEQHDVGGEDDCQPVQVAVANRAVFRAALLRWRPNQSLRRRRGRRQLDPSRRGEERRRGRWPTVLLSSATDGGLPLVLARFVRGLSTHQGSGCLRRLRTAATAAKCHRAPVDSHRVADQMPTGPSTSRRRAPHAASPLPRG